MRPSFAQVLSNITQLITLAVGIVIGVLIAPRFEGRVQAQGAAPPTTNTNVQTLQNFMTSPALAANVLLAHELQVDHAVVNGYDLLLLNQNIVNYLATLPVANPTVLTSIGDRSKATTRFTLPPPQQKTDSLDERSAQCPNTDS